MLIADKAFFFLKGQDVNGPGQALLKWTIQYSAVPAFIAES